MSASSQSPPPTAPSRSAPIRLFAAASDLEERAKIMASSDLTNHWSKTQCWTMREMLGYDGNHSGGRIEFLVVSNYLVDPNFLLDEVPELLSIDNQVVVFYGQSDSSFEPWRNASSSGRFDAIRLDATEPPRTASNPTSNRIPYSVHHTKMFLVGFTDGILRVVIHTCNLRRCDVYLKSQAAYVEDFVLKSPSSTATTAYEETLISYLDTYGYRKRCRWSTGSGSASAAVGGKKSSEETLARMLRRYDFASASAALIPSTPGYHHHAVAGLGQQHQEPVGHLALRRAVARYAADPGGGNRGRQRQDILSRPIVCQFSSIGSLSLKWLRELQISMDTGLSRRPEAAAAADNNNNNNNNNNNSSTTPLNLQLVYPTVEEIRSSIEGYDGGASVPGRSNNVSKPFLSGLFYKWSASSSESSSSDSNPLWKGRHVPHIKTFYQFNADRRSLDWFVLSSHNLSKAAWGEVQSVKKYGGERRLFVRHWELGVFVSPRLLKAKRMVPWEPPSSSRSSSSPSDNNDDDDDDDDEEEVVVTVPLPFKAHPDRYGAGDRPWAVDGRYWIPDRFGRLSVSFNMG